MCNKNEFPLIAGFLVSFVYSASTGGRSVLGIALNRTINNQAAPKRDWLIGLGFSG